MVKAKHKNVTKESEHKPTTGNGQRVFMDTQFVCEGIGRSGQGRLYHNNKCNTTQNPAFNWRNMVEKSTDTRRLMIFGTVVVATGSSLPYGI